MYNFEELNQDQLKETNGGCQAFASLNLLIGRAGKTIGKLFGSMFA